MPPALIKKIMGNTDCSCRVSSISHTYRPLLFVSFSKKTINPIERSFLEFTAVPGIFSCNSLLCVFCQFCTSFPSELFTFLFLLMLSSDGLFIVRYYYVLEIILGRDHAAFPCGVILNNYHLRFLHSSELHYFLRGWL